MLDLVNVGSLVCFVGEGTLRGQEWSPLRDGDLGMVVDVHKDVADVHWLRTRERDYICREDLFQYGLVKLLSPRQEKSSRV